MSRNQCDGCVRKLPINQYGNHVGPGAFWYGDVQACTADRYKDDPPSTDSAERSALLRGFTYSDEG